MVKWIQGKSGTNWTYDDANKAMEFLQKVPAKYRSNDRNIINRMRKTLYNLQVELSKEENEKTDKNNSKKEAPKKKVPSGKKVSYDDDIVAVYDDKGKKVYEGMLDYSPYQLDDSKWNENDKNYDLPKGYKMVGK